MSLASSTASQHNFIEAGWDIRVDSTSPGGPSHMKILRIGTPTIAILSKLEKYMGSVTAKYEHTPLYFISENNELQKLLFGLGAIRCFMNYEGLGCAKINLLNYTYLCAFFPEDNQHDRRTSVVYKFTPNSGLCKELWMSQQMPGQQRGHEDERKWESTYRYGELVISKIGDAKLENVTTIHNELEKNPSCIYLTREVYAGLQRASIWFLWLCIYIDANIDARDHRKALSRGVYMRLFTWFSFLRAVPRPRMVTDQSGVVFVACNIVNRPSDLPPTLDYLHCISTAQRPLELMQISENLPYPLMRQCMQSHSDGDCQLREAFDRFFPISRELGDADNLPITWVMNSELFTQKWKEFKSLYGSSLTLEDVSIIEKNVYADQNPWSKRSILAFLGAGLRPVRKPERSQPPQALQSTVAMPPQQAAAPVVPSSPPASPTVNDSDLVSAMARAFDLEDETARINEAQSLFGNTADDVRARIISLNVDSPLNDDIAGIIVDCIFNRNWTINDVRNFVDRVGYLADIIPGFLDGEFSTDSPIMQEGTDAESVRTAVIEIVNSLKRNFSSESQPRQLSNEMLESSDKLCDEIFTAVVDQKKTYKMLFSFFAGHLVPSLDVPPAMDGDALVIQSPVVSPAVSSVVAVAPQRCSVPEVRLNAVDQAEQLGLTRIHARGDGNCLFNAVGIAIAIAGNIQIPNLNVSLQVLLATLRNLALGQFTDARPILAVSEYFKSLFGSQISDNALTLLISSLHQDDIAVYIRGEARPIPQSAGNDLVRLSALERFLRVAWEQTQSLVQFSLRERVGTFQLPSQLPPAVSHLLATIPQNPTIEQYRQIYTRKNGKFGEMVDVALLAIYLGIPIYVITRGAVGIIAFDPTGNFIEAPSLSNAPGNAIILHNNGSSGEMVAHWDLYTNNPDIEPRWIATT
ncbi:MAG: hypothetical protein LBI34_01980 [Puniceicoccales bacterium]|jgi:hypothetical protein|nr:hypothetical protein [Puniceicoccales bacterium]